MIEQILDYFNNPLDYRRDNSHISVNPANGATNMWTIKCLQEVVPIQEIGQGAFGVAYRLPDNTVLKVAQRKDEAYDAYMRYVAENQNNPWVPQLYATHPLKDDRIIYIIEYLPYPMERELAITLGYDIHNNVIKCPQLQHLVATFGVMNLNDVRYGNVSMRGDQPVLLDPCSHYIEPLRAINYIAEPPDLFRDHNRLYQHARIPEPENLNERAKKIKAQRGHMHLIPEQHNQGHLRGRRRGW